MVTVQRYSGGVTAWLTHIRDAVAVLRRMTYSAHPTIKIPTTPRGLSGLAALRPVAIGGSQLESLDTEGYQGRSATGAGKYRRAVMKIVDGRARFSASDLSNFLGCRYLIRLDLLMAHGYLKPDKVFDLGLKKLIERGEAHEAAVLDRFRADLTHSTLGG